MDKVWVTRRPWTSSKQDGNVAVPTRTRHGQIAILANDQLFPVLMSLLLSGYPIRVVLTENRHDAKLLQLMVFLLAKILKMSTTTK